MQIAITAELIAVSMLAMQCWHHGMPCSYGVTHLHALAVYIQGCVMIEGVLSLHTCISFT